MKQRLRYLDGHRGIAILLVLLVHAYARWPQVVPYGDRFTPYFSYGWVGVRLFFLISGFVILMTLDNCETFRQFIFKRWLRLFPAMLFCSALVFVLAPLFPERPAGAPTYMSLLPGLLFVEPMWITHVVGHFVRPLEDAYWSLYAEVKFYVIAGLVYFAFGRAILVMVLTGIAAVTFFLEWLGNLHGIPVFQLASKVALSLSFNHFGWFAAGAATYLYTRSSDARWLLTAAVVALCSSVCVKWWDVAAVWETEATMATLAASAFFLLSVVSARTKLFLENSVFQFLGYVSYPLYLLHENLMVASIAKLGRAWPALPMFLLPVLPVALLLLIAYLCARFVEPQMRRMILRIGGLRRLRETRETSDSKSSEQVNT